jgi:tRNA wybutosine-synthesizing protein 1
VQNNNTRTQKEKKQTNKKKMLRKRQTKQQQRRATSREKKDALTQSNKSRRLRVVMTAKNNTALSLDVAKKLLLFAATVGFVLYEYRYYYAKKEKKRVEEIFKDDDDGVKVKAKTTTEKKKKTKREQKQSENNDSDDDEIDDDSVRIFYASTSGNARSLAQKLGADLDRTVIDLSEVLEPEKTFANEEEGIYLTERKKKVLKCAIFVVSTTTGGEIASDCKHFMKWCEEQAYDERAGWSYLKELKFCVFGVGDSQYEENFNRAARMIDKHFARMGAERILRKFDGDESSEVEMKTQFEKWTEKLKGRVFPPTTAEKRRQKKKKEADEENVKEEDEVENDDNEEEEDEVDRSDTESYFSGSEDDMDVEDVGGDGSARDPNAPKPEMVTPKLRKALTKQGYKILGTHSGVKLCRWTKAMLRGRGGCYKHAFYGIESHRCMETTPSLACANKCVFCWRHHTNPVGKEWKWEMNPAEDIVNDALGQHRKMINEMRGVPGVTEAKLQEGMDPRHCALSLVGEPIMYPEIGKFVTLLHEKRISTFLVTNAQFPKAIEDLPPITQLYVSVDAATPETLKAIDRPLHSDYWDRFVGSLSSLKTKPQRTVYRLTLVAGWNLAEAEEYAKLVKLGEPDFIEIKGVTYCGSSDKSASALTMKNVPYHEDVVKFSQEICRLTNIEQEEKGASSYELACEHSHSCCVLLARTKDYKIDGEWHTWIDYEKFQDLVAKGEPFEAKDYICKTPEWSVFGAKEGGFDPNQTRVRKIRNHPAKNTTT